MKLRMLLTALSLALGTQLAWPVYGSVLPDSCGGDLELTGTHEKVAAKPFKFEALQKEITPLFKLAGLDIIAREITKRDIRRKVFELEYQLPLLREEIIKRGDGKKERKERAELLERTEAKLKAFEDNIGWYTDSIQFLATARKLRELAGPEEVPDEVIEGFVKFQRFSLEKFMKYLLKDDWAGPDRDKNAKLLKKTTELIGELPFDVYREAIMTNTARYLKKIDKREFDMNDLEGGLHPFRRHLRKIQLIADGANIFALDPKLKPIAELADFRLPPDIEAKYGTLSYVTPVENPVVLSQPLYEVITDLVTKLGDAKDIGQFEELFVQIYMTVYDGQPRGNKTAALAKAAKLVKYLPNYEEPSQTGARVYGDVKRWGLLKELRREFSGK